MAEIGFAIIGTGTVAERHALAIDRLEGGKLVAVYDVDQARCRAFAEEHGTEPVFSLDGLLARESVQVVTVATPSGLHADVAVPAAQAGKNIICEKPLEVTVERANLIIDAARENNVLLASVFQARFGENVRRIRDALEKGRFGRLILAGAQVKWYRSPEYYAGAGWRGTWKLDGGGALMNQSIHLIDLLLYLAGPPEEVTARCATMTHPGLEVEDTAAALVRFANGALGVIEASTSCAPGFPRRLELSGAHGSIVLEDERLVRWQFDREEPQDDEIRRAGSVGTGMHSGASDPRAAGFEGHRRQFQDMVDALHEGRAPLIPGDEGRRAVELICAIYESSRSGSTVRIGGGDK
jgi:UDP-N-acetyl-2-amino-2-deoxyglucuronate dehydrogenase